MKKCPICNTKAEKNQNYCLNCTWEFEYYFDELSEEEKKRYLNRFKSFKMIYEKSMENKEVDKLKEELKVKTQKNQDLEIKYNMLEKNMKNGKTVSSTSNDSKTFLSLFTIKINDNNLFSFLWKSIQVFYVVFVLLLFFGVIIYLTWILIKHNNEARIIVILLEGLFFSWIIYRSFKRILIKVELVKREEKSPIMYFIGTLISWAFYIVYMVFQWFLFKFKR